MNSPRPDSPEKVQTPVSPMPPAMTRSTSQRRISMELQLGAVDGSEDWRNALPSPVRQTPHRRHSGVGRSALNPQRDLHINTGSNQSGTASLPSPRLPFPRSSSELPGGKRLQRHLSLTGATSASEASITVSLTSASLTSPTRPAHTRYSSDLPVSLKAMASPSRESHEPVAFPRPRHDSEATSNYNSTMASYSTGDDSSTQISRSGSQTPAPRHRITVNVADEAPVVYVS